MAPPFAGDDPIYLINNDILWIIFVIRNDNDSSPLVIFAQVHFFTDVTSRFEFSDSEMSNYINKRYQFFYESDTDK